MAFDEDGPQTPAAPTYGTEPWQCPWAASSTGDVSRDKLAVPGIMVVSLSFQLVPLSNHARGSGPNARGINDRVAQDCIATGRVKNLNDIQLVIDGRGRERRR